MNNPCPQCGKETTKNQIIYYCSNCDRRYKIEMIQRGKKIYQKTSKFLNEIQKENHRFKEKIRDYIHSGYFPSRFSDEEILLNFLDYDKKFNELNKTLEKLKGKVNFRVK